MGRTVQIHSGDFWFRREGSHSVRWALIDSFAYDDHRVFYLEETGMVLECLAFPSLEAARIGLSGDGYRRLMQDFEAYSLLTPPRPPYRFRS